MIHAYNEYHLHHLQPRLGMMFDVAVCYEGWDIDEFAARFAESNVARGIEIKSPRYMSGMSGTEMYTEIAGTSNRYDFSFMERSDAYWVGHTVTYLQWYWNRPFRKLFDAYPCSRLLSNYPTFHETDISRTCEIVGKVLIPENVIKRRRKELGMTQKELAERSGVSLGTIRAYEQGVLDICNASGYTLVALSEALFIEVGEILLG